MSGPRRRAPGAPGAPGRQGPPSRRTLLLGLGAVPAGLLAGSLAGCDGLGQPTGDTGNQQGYVAGDGTYRLVPAAERSDPVEISGAATDGTEISVADWRGQVVVVNVWYAACAPCRKEAPDLAAVAADTPDVRFLGINTRDGEASAKAFESRFGVPYPSLLDNGTGEAVLALRGTIPPQAIPSTVVLDVEGRPAARVVGRVQEDVLRGLIDDVRASSSAGSAGGA